MNMQIDLEKGIANVGDEQNEGGHGARKTRGSVW